MKERMSRALVPVISRLPAIVSPRRDSKDTHSARAGSVSGNDFDLVEQATHLKNRSQVERYLPDILGRALARIWLDQGFRERFAASPKVTLAEYGVHLPDRISIEFVTEGTIRPRVVVYEAQRFGRPPKRLLYLQLVMMAGK